MNCLPDQEVIPVNGENKNHTVGGSKVFCCAVVLILIASIYFAYRQVFFNFFAGDDFDYLPWLKIAMSQPEVIWRNFHGSWMGNQSSLFYRPLVTASMALEFLIWGPNGLLFRIMNLTFMGCTAFFSALIVLELTEPSSNALSTKTENRLIALMTSALFVLYPSHSESVVWIIGRVDGMSTLFIVSSLWLYIRWRKSDKHVFLGCSLFAAALAFACKEMAIVLPPIIAACEMFFGDLFQAKPDAPERLADRIKRVAICAGPFFVLLFLYFVLRRIVLGTFVGGYDNSLMVALDPTNISRFLHALTMLIVPVNQAVIGWHSNIVKAWELGITLCLLLSIFTFIAKPSSRRLIGFSLTSFVLALVPVYKIFSISIYLEGSRLGYLATVPLCLFLSCGLALTSYKKEITRALPILAACMLAISSCLLYTNNQAWAGAGNLANAIQAQLKILYNKTAGDPEVILVGIPVSYKGAYVCLNAIDGMTKFPQIDRDIFHCSMLDSSDPVLPFGFLKDSIWKGRNRFKSYFWNSTNQTLAPVNIDAAKSGTHVWKGEALKSLLSSDDISTKIKSEPDGGLRINTGLNAKERSCININIENMPCWLTDFISIKLRLVDSFRQPSNADLLLLYTNKIVKEPNSLFRAHAHLIQTDRRQEILLPLHSVPEWAFGGTTQKLQMRLPVGSKLIIDEISVKSPNIVIPAISFSDSGYFNNRATLRLSDDKPKQVLAYSAENIEGASSVMLEITRAGTYFAEHNCANLDQTSLKFINLAAPHGQLDLTLKDFPSSGTYQLRARALGKDGRLVGLAGDHVNVSVQKR